MTKPQKSDTIVVTLPSGWARAALAGVESALLAWLIPTAAVVAGFWTVAANPWFQEETWENAAHLGGNFWALSLFAPAPLGAVQVGLWPLGWALVQVLLLRLLLTQVKNYDPMALWAAIPALVLTSVLLCLFGSSASWWRVGLGALVISGLASTWAWLSYGPGLKWPRWVRLSLRTGTVAAVVALVLSAVLVLVAWIGNWGAFVAATSLFDVGGYSAFLFNLLEVLYFPNLAACAWAWVVGAGFFGPGPELVGPGNPATTALPLPVWVMVPAGPGPNLIWVGVVVGVLFGLVVAWLNRKETLVHSLARFGVGAALFLAVIFLWMWASGGSLGGNQLAMLGPGPLEVMWRTALVVVLPALLVTAILHRETFDFTGDKVSKGYRFARSQFIGQPESARDLSEEGSEGGLVEYLEEGPAEIDAEESVAEGDVGIEIGEVTGGEAGDQLDADSPSEEDEK